jgi:hypothetical protein
MRNNKPPPSLARRSLGEGGTSGLRVTPASKRITIGIITRKGKLSPATEKFCQFAKDRVRG